jgi:hypothetical protein
MPISHDNLIETLNAIQDVLRVQASLNRIMKRAKVPFTEWASGGPKPDMATLNGIVHLEQCSETVRSYCNRVQKELISLLEKNDVTLTVEETSALTK